MSITEKVESIGNVLTSTMLRRVNETYKNKRKPVIIDGKEYLYLIMHPRSYYLLMVLLARAKYKHKQWVIRYNQWRESRGELPYQETEGEIGTFDGVNFKGTT